MRVGHVIGKVTVNQVHPLLAGASWKLVVPLSWEGLIDREQGRGEAIVVYDELASNLDSLIAIGEGTEAAAPFQPDLKPVDAYNAALLDEIRVVAPEST